jgi:two-component system response regulator FixJ
MTVSRRIAVVDDVAAIRHSLKALLETYGYEVELYDSADTFFDNLRDEGLSCVLFDVRMPGMNGLEAQRLLSARASWLPAIIITGHGDIDMAVSAMKEGAFDFIEKPIDDERLVSSIAAAVDRARAAKANEAKREEILQKYRRLTKRERDVMRLVADGYSTLAIASMLSISVRTVDHHRASILAKMQVTSLSQLIKLALEIERDG